MVLIRVYQINLKLFEELRKNFFLYTLKDTELWANRFSLIGDLGSPVGMLIIAPIFNSGDLNTLESELRKLLRGSIIKTTIITQTLLGRICINKLEQTKSRIYEKILIEEYKMTKEEIKDYLNRT